MTNKNESGENVLGIPAWYDLLVNSIGKTEEDEEYIETIVRETEKAQKWRDETVRRLYDDNKIQRFDR